MGIFALSVNCKDSSGYRLRQDELQVMVFNRFIVRIFMGVYRRHFAGPGKPMGTMGPYSLLQASYEDGSRCMTGSKGLKCHHASQHLKVIPCREILNVASTSFYIVLKPSFGIPPGFINLSLIAYKYNMKNKN
jgi:hypothetical protein